MVGDCTAWTNQVDVEAAQHHVKLLYSDQATFKYSAVQILDGASCTFKSIHSHEGKATGFFCPRIKNNMTVLNLSFFTKELLKIIFRYTSRQSSYIKVIPWISIIWAPGPTPIP